MKIKKEKNKHVRNSLIIIYLASFFLALANALPAYINSSMIESAVNVRYVGFYFASANTVTFFAMLFFPRLIRRIGNLFSTKLMLGLGVASSLALALRPAPLYLLIFFVTIWMATSLLFNNMDIFLESFTDNYSTGKTRAIYFSIMNLAWIFAPFLASRIVMINDSYGLVYLISSILLLIFFIIITFNKKKINKKVTYDKVNTKETIIDFWKNLNLRGIYFTSFFLSLFYNSAVVFIPIHLHTNLGLDWGALGIIFSVALVPFVLVEVPAGIIADKYLGEKEITYVGLSILIISLLLFFFVKSSNPWVWGAILFLSRVGAALVEAMRESGFFKIVDVENVSHINFLRTSSPLGYLVGSGLGVLVLLFYPIQYLFIFLAILFLYSFYFVFITKDSK